MKHQKHSNWVCSENAEVYSPQNGYPYLYSEKIALATKGGVGVPYAPKMLALSELGWPPLRQSSEPKCAEFRASAANYQNAHLEHQQICNI